MPCYLADLDDAHARLLAQALNRTRGEDDPEKKARLLEEVLQTITVDEALRYLPETAGSLDNGRTAEPLAGKSILEVAPEVTAGPSSGTLNAPPHDPGEE